jgi:hypothetical protein
MIDNTMNKITLISAETSRQLAKTASKKKSVIISAHGCIPNEHWLPDGWVLQEGVTVVEKLPKSLQMYAQPGCSLGGDVRWAIGGLDKPTTSNVKKDFALNYYPKDLKPQFLQLSINKAKPANWCDLVVLKPSTAMEYDEYDRFIVKATCSGVISTLIGAGYRYANYVGHFCWYRGSRHEMDALEKDHPLTFEAQKVTNVAPSILALKELQAKNMGRSMLKPVSRKQKPPRPKNKPITKGKQRAPSVQDRIKHFEKKSK